MSERKLGNCPFCGHPDEGGMRVAGSEDMSRWAAFCDKCDAQGPMASSCDEAIDAWNRRARAGGGS